MVGRNQRKIQVLEYMETCLETTSFELACALNLEIHNARTLLKKYNRQGLISRKRTDMWGTRVHKITEKGRDRLSYLKEFERSGLVGNSP